MARSYKKHPYCGDRKSRFYKNYANRRLRRLPIEEEIPSGKNYKRYTCSWEICDYWNYQPGPFFICVGTLKKRVRKLLFGVGIKIVK